MMRTSKPPTPPPREPADRSFWRFEPINAPTEWIESYRPGGFHPVHPGDLLGDGRYMVACKLGYGAFSTVWLAQDNRRSILVAIKVARADARKVLEELRLCRMLTESNRAESSMKHVVTLIDHFTQIGPNGEHHCLVFEPMGPSADQMLEGIPSAFNEAGYPDDVVSPNEGPPPPPVPSLPPPGSHLGSSLQKSSRSNITLDQRKSLLKQLLQGLHCLHSNNIAHGDVNPGNLLLSIQPLSSQDIQQVLISCKSSGKSVPVRRIDWKQDAWAPRYLCLEHPLTDLVDLDKGLLAKISDLGAAFTFDNPPTADRCATPAALRAPEIVLQGPIDQKIDIWSFGCLIYEVLTGRLLFQVSGLTDVPREENDDDHLLQMVDMLGLPPPEIFERWPRRRRYFDEHLQLIRSDVSSSEIAEGELYQGPSLEEAFQESMPEGIENEEATHILTLLRAILQYEPSLRPSTEELLEDQWFRSMA